MKLPLSPAVFSILNSLIEQRCGMSYDVSDCDLLADKISPRAVERGFDSLLDYYYFLKYDPAGSGELDLLVEQLMVHETYFFREAEHLEALCDEVIAPAVARGERAKVWCAACATGEEPLTLAMMLDERGFLGDVDLTASDISGHALSRAASGRYRGRALRAVPAPAYGRWLYHSGDDVAVRSDLLSTVKYRQVNLLDAQAVAALGSFDAIICRNVLIYFRDETARRAVSILTEQLRPGGYLMVGVSESLLRFGTSLESVERRGSFFYQRAP